MREERVEGIQKSNRGGGSREDRSRGQCRGQGVSTRTVGEEGSDGSTVLSCCSLQVFPQASTSKNTTQPSLPLFMRYI